jgi:abequosyltransferase
MTKLLTIGIPTFNRAQLLDRQLAWLAQAVKGFESECEIIISDNCSSDDTPEVVKKWQSVFSNTALKLNRNSENVGAIRNIAYCINEATNKHVWVISDDDVVYAKTLPYVLRILTEYPDLGLLILNFSGRYAKTGRLVLERCYDVESDGVSSNGKALFERCFEQHIGGVALTTALVYRTDLAQRAIQEWPSGLNNTGFQIYVTAFCALHGSAKVTMDTFLEYAAGTAFWEVDKEIFLNFRYAELPEVYVKLMKMGYSDRLCRRKVLDRSKKFKSKFILRSFGRRPVTTINVLSRYLASVLRVTFYHSWR